MTVGRGSGPIRWCGESAESLVVNQAGLCRMVAAHGAIRIWFVSDGRCTQGNQDCGES